MMEEIVDIRKGPNDNVNAAPAGMVNPFADIPQAQRTTADDRKVAKQNVQVNEPGHSVNKMDPRCKS